MKGVEAGVGVEREITIFFKILIENLAKFYIKFLQIYSV